MKKIIYTFTLSFAFYTQFINAFHWENLIYSHENNNSPIKNNDENAILESVFLDILIHLPCESYHIASLTSADKDQIRSSANIANFFHGLTKWINSLFICNHKFIR